MAKHTGIVPIKGTVGGLTFSDTKFGTIVKSKRKNVAQTYVQRERADMMRVVSPLASRIRDAFAPWSGLQDSRYWTRLLKLIWANVGEGAGFNAICLHGLAGFQLNGRTPLRKKFGGEFTIVPEGGGSGARVEIPAFYPRKLRIPTEATHYRFLAGRVTVDGKRADGEFAHSAWMAKGECGGAAIELPPGDHRDAAQLMVMGVEFVLSINGYFEQLDSHGAAAIVEVVPAAVKVRTGMPRFVRLGNCVPCKVREKAVVEKVEIAVAECAPCGVPWAMPEGFGEVAEVFVPRPFETLSVRGDAGEGTVVSRAQRLALARAACRMEEQVERSAEPVVAVVPVLSLLKPKRGHRQAAQPRGSFDMSSKRKALSVAEVSLPLSEVRMPDTLAPVGKPRKKKRRGGSMRKGSGGGAGHSGSGSGRAAAW